MEIPKEYVDYYQEWQDRQLFICLDEGDFTFPDGVTYKITDLWWAYVTRADEESKS
jgi:hypothetical protein